MRLPLRGATLQPSLFSLQPCPQHRDCRGEGPGEAQDGAPEGKKWDQEVKGRGGEG